MKLTLFLGCNIPARLKAYEMSSRAVLSALGVTLVDVPEFGCCGYPLRNINFKAFVLSSARNLALAEMHNRDLIVLCKCGYGTLRMAQYLMKENAQLQEEVNAVLSREDLRYEGQVRVKHLLSVLFHDVGVKAIEDKVTRPHKNLRVAAHYGCHALRPSRIVQFDDPVAPSIFDQLVAATGAQSVDWPTRLDCCGNPLLGVRDKLSFGFTEKKLADAKKAGAHYVATGCVFCQMQFETVRKAMKANGNSNHHIPSMLYTQLLGLSMDIKEDDLGLYGNATGMRGGRGPLYHVERFLDCP